MFSSNNKQHNAFTMLEILLAFVIALPTLLITVRAVITISDAYWRMLDRRIAASRASSLFAMLKEPLYHAGFAMLPDNEFSSQFSVSTTEPFSWKRAVSCFNNEKIRIFYAVPLYTLVKDTVSTEDAYCEVSFTSTIDAGQFSVSPFNIKSYLVLKSANIENRVFRIVGIKNNSLRVTSQTDKSYLICKNDMIMGLRAIEASVDRGIFYTKDFRASGSQPRIDGIWKIDFDYNESRGIVTITVIATSDRDCDTAKIEGKEILPSRLISELSLLLKQTKRNLFCYKRSFFLANLH